MQLNEYQDKALLSAIYPQKGRNISYPALGLCGESGEVAEKVKKILRDQEGVYTYENRAEIGKELGDVLWYVSALAYEFDLTLEEIAGVNIAKLSSRKERGVLSGAGDNR